MGKLYELIQEHLDSQEYDVSERQLALRLGVSPTTIGNWREPKKLIAKEHLVAIAKVTRVPYSRVLQALLEDIGYWEEAGDAVATEPTVSDVMTARRRREEMQRTQKKAARPDPKP